METNLSKTNNMKNALITGASGSLGKVILEKLISLKWKVFAHHLNNTVEKNSKQLKWITGDFSSIKGIDEFNINLKKNLNNQKIDLLIHCAGIQIKGKPISTSDASKLSLVNLVAPYSISESIIHEMSLGGNIIFISSICANKATIEAEFYGATKAGLNSLVKSLAYRYGQKGVRVNGIEPSIMKSKQTEDVWRNKEFISRITRQNPFNRLTNLNDITNLILLIIDKKANWLTGQILVADGGSLLGYGETIWEK